MNTKGRPPIDMVGKRVGTLTVVEMSHQKPSGRKEAYWKCLCDCGKIKIASGNSLRSGQCFCSGCCSKGTKPIKDLLGRRFGKLLVIEEGERTRHNKVRWRCRCDCGNVKDIQRSVLLQGDAQSCGCEQQKYSGLSGILHGEARSRQHTHRYDLWVSARTRARSKGLDFNISLEELVIPEKCPLLGIPLKRSSKGGSRENSPTLDRIFSDQGYVSGNVWVISHKANTMKSNASLEELKELVKNLEKKIDELGSHTRENERPIDVV